MKFLKEDSIIKIHTFGEDEFSSLYWIAFYLQERKMVRNITVEKKTQKVYGGIPTTVSHVYTGHADFEIEL